MYVKTIDLKGNYKYFDSDGYEVRVIRETGRHEGRIPDDVFRFLTPAFKSEVKEPIKGSSAVGFKKQKIRLVPPKKPSFWSMVAAWFNKIFSNGKRN